ncbi:hypothetical protein CBER1_11239 [Cercospora berteroae]|uniref:Uncharacterized protein n=1 Tax=Cercospora berteroae TaxID=357750 RepID=A0A2S6CGX7_9PEZI|nr:hypothetical protein CBER1_11239 [Cercospora berteroae]
MTTITLRNTAGEVRAATGYSDVAWKYFMRITRRLAEELISLPAWAVGQEGILYSAQHDLRRLAQTIRAAHGGSRITSWDSVPPGQEAAAVDVLNSILQREHLEPVSRDIVRWRMIMAYRYLRRDLRREGPSELLQQPALDSASTPAPTAPPDAETPSTPLPSIGNLLRESEEEGAGVIDGEEQDNVESV